MKIAKQITALGLALVMMFAIFIFPTSALSSASDSIFTSYDATTDQITLRWDVQNYISGYQIQRRDESNRWVTCGTAGRNRTSFTEKDLKAGEHYEYRIRTIQNKYFLFWRIKTTYGSWDYINTATVPNSATEDQIMVVHNSVEELSFVIAQTLNCDGYEVKTSNLKAPWSRCGALGGGVYKILRLTHSPVMCVRIRAYTYTTVNGERIYNYGEWSSIKIIKINK